MALILDVFGPLHLLFLVIQLVSGMAGWSNHELSGLFVVLFGCLVHSLVFTYFIGTGWSIRHAVQRGELDEAYFWRSRAWYRSRAYPLTGLAVVSLLLLAILGAAVHSYRPLPGSWGWVHPVAAWMAVFLNAQAFLLQRAQVWQHGTLIDEANAFIESGQPPSSDRGSGAGQKEFTRARSSLGPARFCFYLGAAIWVPFIVLRYIVASSYHSLSPFPFLYLYLAFTGLGALLVFFPRK